MGASSGGACQVGASSGGECRVGASSCAPLAGAAFGGRGRRSRTGVSALTGVARRR
ncbi:MAG: hypothetical protein AVDCRST_MAG53-664 [uncultured Solirubrobacteraceae bacterium]|uniref:Uncharacterized protein n=1 Tax=uncultured Solirubrobacteraceae bacterium TaxID=1162706 RepID=A0A6J4RUU8_9ACTN|nr:MAG: hypothetical protein AVDCRST_MAG53-664 [uncultured Solirubrobacteraceae bacterium]